VTEPYHVPVLLEEVLALLPADPAGVTVDGTLGGGGHARALAARLAPGESSWRSIATRGPGGVPRLGAEYPDRVTLRRASFGGLVEVLREEGLGPVSGVLLDLGVSSRQLDEGARGFSFLRDGPLDMRMDPQSGAPASELVNEAPVEELKRIFREYGEEPARAAWPGHRRGAAPAAAGHHPGPGQGRGEGPGPTRWQAPGPRVPGPAHRGESGARSPRAVSRGPARGAGAGRQGGGHRLPQPGGPAGETGPSDGRPAVHLPPRVPRCTCGEPGWLRVLTPKAVKPGRDEVERNRGRGALA